MVRALCDVELIVLCTLKHAIESTGSIKSTPGAITVSEIQTFEVPMGIEISKGRIFKKSTDICVCKNINNT